jgi:hypothetical protein
VAGQKGFEPLPPVYMESEEGTVGEEIGQTATKAGSGSPIMVWTELLVDLAPVYDTLQVLEQGHHFSERPPAVWCLTMTIGLSHGTSAGACGAMVHLPPKPSPYL